MDNMSSYCCFLSHVSFIGIVIQLIEQKLQTGSLVRHSRWWTQCQSLRILRSKVAFLRWIAGFIRCKCSIKVGYFVIQPWEY